MFFSLLDQNLYFLCLSRAQSLTFSFKYNVVKLYSQHRRQSSNSQVGLAAPQNLECCGKVCEPFLIS